MESRKIALASIIHVLEQVAENKKQMILEDSNMKKYPQKQQQSLQRNNTQKNNAQQGRNESGKTASVREGRYGTNVAPVPISEETLERLAIEQQRVLAYKQVDHLEKMINGLREDFTRFLVRQPYGWYKLEDPEIYYCDQVNGFFPDFATYQPLFSTAREKKLIDVNLSFEGLQGKLMTDKEYRKAFVFSGSSTYFRNLLGWKHLFFGYPESRSSDERSLLNYTVATLNEHGPLCRDGTLAPDSHWNGIVGRYVLYLPICRAEREDRLEEWFSRGFALPNTGLLPESYRTLELLESYRDTFDLAWLCGDWNEVKRHRLAAQVLNGKRKSLDGGEDISLDVIKKNLREQARAGKLVVEDKPRNQQNMHAQTQKPVQQRYTVNTKAATVYDGQAGRSAGSAIPQTHGVNTVRAMRAFITEKELEKLALEEQQTLVWQQIGHLEAMIQELREDFTQFLARAPYGWYKLADKGIYYCNQVNGFFPDFKTYNIAESAVYYNKKTDVNLSFNGMHGELMNDEEYRKAFTAKGSSEYFTETLGWKHPFFGYPVDHSSSDSNYKNYTVATTEPKCPLFRNGRATTNYAGGFYWNGSSYGSNALYIPIVRAEHTDRLKEWFARGFAFPTSGLSKESYRTLEVLRTFPILLSPMYLCEDWTQEKRHAINGMVKNGKIASVDGSKDISLRALINELKAQAGAGKLKLENKEVLEAFKGRLVGCEKQRADIDPYDGKLLTDPNRGHWDLWEGLKRPARDGEFAVKLEGDLVARDPAADIREDGVIGIDFGTKSTVVVFQRNSEHTMPMRIGTGQLSKQVESWHYENPTVMEFIDLEHFLQCYRRKEGRPETLWEDMTTSHTAFNDLMNSASKEFYAYLNELKQWAGDEKRSIRLMDKQGKDVTLPPYLSIKPGEFDPIELYAYYIGLYINNMYNGIYLDYILSYPVTYKKEVRDAIVASFTRGIKKSLPESLLNDRDVMSRFRVTLGASEPVAYALCALQEYGLEPEEDKSICYGVFDFGGGTTDFDFGLFSEAQGKEARRYDYVVRSFGATGDQFLGGENLLELLAYEVFKDNQDKMRKENLTFTLPPQCKPFAGSETLLKDSQEAKLNMAQLMEKLRPYWERRTGYDKMFQDGKLKVILFDVNGSQKPQVELNVDPKKLDRILHNRIETGVYNFFVGLKEAFNLPEATEQVEMVHIFLAGNSSKSLIVKEIFEKHIKDLNRQIAGNEEDNFFTLYPPLGSAEVENFCRERELPIPDRNVESPTGKTGVAFGLLMGRHGGKIKLDAEKRSDEQIKFGYYIGFEKKRRFKLLTDRELSYNTWEYFIDAEEQDFTLYYTNQPACTEGNMSIADEAIARKACRIPVTDDNASVYYRAVSPTDIEYVVATEQGIAEEKYLCKPIRIKLEME